ncbi:hypothetical protein KIW84_046033 [Lathyrus oleraceus]|uniref:Uncharacterized protein n=1 Tax=Pisum sativum TaxID=3888 RepID=A0A9D4XLR0_PEA|nr:hypothetical protein KIW84_046033 [Pisum sativum]
MNELHEMAYRGETVSISMSVLQKLGKDKNGKFYGVGSLAFNYRNGDRTIFTRIEYEEGLSRQPVLTLEMVEIMRHIALNEARETVQKVEMEKMGKKQFELEEALRVFQCVFHVPHL